MFSVKLGVKNVKFEAVDAKKVDKFFKEEKFDLANDILKKEPELSDINRNRFFMC